MLGVYGEEEVEALGTRYWFKSTLWLSVTPLQFAEDPCIVCWDGGGGGGGSGGCC